MQGERHSEGPHGTASSCAEQWKPAARAASSGSEAEEPILNTNQQNIHPAANSAPTPHSLEAVTDTNSIHTEANASLLHNQKSDICGETNSVQEKYQITNKRKKTPTS